MAVQRLYVLLCGFEIIPKTVSTRGRGARFVMSEPISAYLIETNEGLILFDTGINTDNIWDKDKAEAYFTNKGWNPPPVVFPEHDLLKQLADIGVGPADVSKVVLSHMHADHTGNLKHFTHVPVVVQRAEYDHAFASPAPNAFFPTDYDMPGIEWRIVDGDWSATRGLTFVATRGHTPGHQSAVLDLPRTGRVVLTADAGDLQENFDEEVLPGESIDDPAALASIRKLKALAAGGQLFLGHDPQFVQRLRLAPDYYD